MNKVIKFSLIVGAFTAFVLPTLAQQNQLDLRSKKTIGKANPSFEFNQIHYKGAISQTNTDVFVKPIRSNNLVLRNEIGAITVLHGKANKLNKTMVNTETSVRDFILENKKLLLLTDLEQLVKLDETKDDLGIAHLTFNRTVEGISLFGGQIKAHLNGDDIVVQGDFSERTFNKNTTNLKSASDVHPIAIDAVGKVTIDDFWDDRWQLAAGKGVKSELFWVEQQGKWNLAYVVDYFPNHLFWYRIIVNANSGEVIQQYTKTCAINGPTTTNATDLNNQSRTLNTYELNGKFYMIDATKSMYSSTRSSLPDNPIGAIWTIDAKNTNGSSIYQISNSTNTFADKAAVSAHHNAGIAYEYFKNTHGRNSINGAGGTMISVVNVTDNGVGLDNAYWNGNAMYYGNGKSAFKPLAGSLDVAGHEMTHGVVGSSANLEYYSQSGAINESMADIFGAMMDGDDWKIGEDIVKTTYFPSGALRDLSNPHNGASSLGQNGYQPKKMSEYYTGTDDNQGVHINSGIPNYAYYLIATAIGKSDAEKIYYRTLTFYLTSSSKFLDLRYAAINAATDLFGASSNQVAKIKESFDAVEIFDPNGNGSSGDAENDLPKNNGTENILSIDVDPTNSNTLYRSSTAGANFEALTKTKFLRKPSVVDDGSFCVFVADDNTIKRINLKGSITETVLSSQTIWDNVAISRDGKRLAAISTDVDSSIYVYDFNSAKWTRFQLYNPTNSSGLNGSGVLYADAIEFDYSGEKILYDARNLIKNTGGQDLDYWDIGQIKVWDNKANNWGDGKIEKLFTQLPADVSIGNPTYAKNSPYIIAFDYIDEYNDEYALMAKNTVSGKTGTMYGNLRLSYPSFSNDDTKILFDAETQAGDPVVGIIGVGTSKITSVGSASSLIGDAKWGVWYANGTRSLLSDKKELISFSFPAIAGNPVGTINGTSIAVTVPASADLNAMVPSFTHSALSSVYVGAVQQFSGASANNFSTSKVYSVIAENGSKKDYTITVTKQSTGINNTSESVHVYPNPSKGQLHVIGFNDGAKAVLTNILGEAVLQTQIVNGIIDISTLGNGMYFISIIGEQGLFTKRIILQK